VHETAQKMGAYQPRFEIRFFEFENQRQQQQGAEGIAHEARLQGVYVIDHAAHDPGQRGDENAAEENQ
jgi:hypothetical protein|tara:strand:- start:286 stop:489 length:204 start_codon:yes stop_codon:yes gene_type:complete